MTDSTGNPAAGSVTLNTTIGRLGETTLQLAEGTASTTLRCLVGTDGPCVGSGEVTGQWSQGSQSAKATATIRFSTPTVFDGGPRLDAGASDGGDGGSPDGGLRDGGIQDAGPAPTSFADMGPILVFGRVGIRYGVSSFTNNTMTSFGWQMAPKTPHFFGDSLAYVRDFGVYLVVADTLLAFDAGIDAGAVLSFPANPELNDISLPTGCGLLEVTELVRGNGTLWARCSDDRLASLSRPGFFIELGDAGSPLAVADELVLVSNDGGLFLKNASVRTPVVSRLGRQFGRFRPAEGPGFWGVAYAPSESRCYRVDISSGGTLMERPALELPADAGCLNAVPAPDRNSFLYRSALPDGGMLGFIELLPLVPDAGTRDGGSDGGAVDGGDLDAGETDAGETDGGETDGGETDGGDADAGPVDSGFSGPPRQFLFGPPTDLRARPPIINVAPDEDALIVGY